MATINAVGGPKSNPTPASVNVKAQVTKPREGDLPQVGESIDFQQVTKPKINAPKIEVDLQKFAADLKEKFKELENMPSFPKNLLVKLDVGLEFGVFVLPEQLFSKLTESDTNQTLKVQPPEFLLQHRVLIQRLIAEPAFQKVIAGFLVNKSA